MRTYSRERKEAVLKKLLPPINLSFKDISEEEGIPVTTIYTWYKKSKLNGGVVYKINKASDSWGAEERFAVIIETAKLSELELSKYCREKGLYTEQIQIWKDAFISNASIKTITSKQEKHQTKVDKKRVAYLEKELHRKDKALAEAAALLILRKKLQAFYEEGNEDD